MRFFTLALLSPLALVSAQVVERHCGAPEPPESLKAEAASIATTIDTETTTLDTGRSSSAGNPYNKINVKTYVHIVTSPEDTGRYTQAMVNEQMEIMNESYKPSGISFTLQSTDYTTNAAWSVSATDADEIEMKTALRKGTYEDLNLYFLSDLGGGLLGFCYFPTSLKTSADPALTLTLDGCINLAGSLPGAEVPNYNLGGTAVHETGHWFGLFHVFQGSACDGPGDYVSDTPKQRVATSGCPTTQDSCPGQKGLDSIHNYMDYSYDVCYEEFTKKQGKRMHRMYSKYRDGK